MSELIKIKDRIAKLLAMAKDTSSPHEAAIAAARARSLMDKYQLSEFDISETSIGAFGCDAVTRYYVATPKYLSSFSVSVAKFNDCQASYEFHPSDRKKKRVMFKGYQSDVDMAIAMFDSLTEAVNRLCKIYMDASHGDKYNVAIGGAFKQAAFQEISKRLSEISEERKQITTSGGMSLVLVKSDAVAAHFGVAKYSESKTRAVATNEEHNAHMAGVVAGRCVTILKSVED